MELLQDNSIKSKRVAIGDYPSDPETFEEILDYYGAPFTLSAPYLQVGRIDKNQGWILHISVVISQVSSLLQLLVPYLLKEGVPFKVPVTRDMTREILGGNLGLETVGKVVSIYPENDDDAFRLSISLIKMTNGYAGPVIPTDIHLGGALYTRYGSFNPIMKADLNGNLTKHIFNGSGRLIKDPYNIPFFLPDGVKWPFAGLASPVQKARKKMLGKKYLIPYLIKNDVKGNVYKGYYMKSLFRPTLCVVKSGNQNALSDDSGRTVYDRLVWQYELYLQLGEHVLMPKIIDFFKEDGNAYLVMECVSGLSLYDRMKKANFNSRSWRELENSDQLNMLDVLLKLIESIRRLHDQGIVHRDMSPGNFIINKHEDIVLIDLELAWSFKEEAPTPPFEYGTYGFISPQQQAQQTPTIKDDIYGIGAIMIAMFTGLSPVKLGVPGLVAFEDNLCFLIGDSGISHLITQCMQANPDDRPTLKPIAGELMKYREVIQKRKSTSDEMRAAAPLPSDDIMELIRHSITGLISYPTVMANNVWYSKYSNSENEAAYVQKEYIRYGGLYEGIGGVLYTLARLKRAGFSIDECISSYDTGLSFIRENYLDNTQETLPGLYRGVAGLAVAIAEGIRSEIINQDREYYRSAIRKCLEVRTEGLDISAGTAGQGVAILRCFSLLDEDFACTRLSELSQKLFTTQTNNGSWPQGVSGASPLGFAQGTAGIAWYLLDHGARLADAMAIESALAALSWLLKKTNDLKTLFEKHNSRKNTGGKQKGDERRGCLQLLIKAYEVTQEVRYRKVAEDCLLKYPSMPVKNDFSQSSGLAGLGELYIEAYRVFNNEAWLQRAQWISHVFKHTFIPSSPASGFWQMEERNEPTADLMEGTGGVLHYLLRMYDPVNIGYRILC